VAYLALIEIVKASSPLRRRPEEVARQKHSRAQVGAAIKKT